MKKMAAALLALAFASALSGCTINTLVANALTGGGAADVFTSDSDPELVGDALPFAIKMYEALLHSTPRHQGLMLTTGSLFIMYANAFVHGPADMLPAYEWEERAAALARAKALYLRGHEILLEALEQRYKGFARAAESEEAMREFAGRFRARDVPVLYWAVAGGLAAYSIDVLDFALSTNIPVWNVMIERAYALDPDFGGATLDEFLVLYYASLPEALGGDVERARFHFELAMEKTGWTSTAALVSYAQAISISERDYETFEARLQMALALDPDDNPSTRLMTILSQRRARWLLDNAHYYFTFLPWPDDAFF
ncbi:MAG: TRAP transporter TatT component family protein [Treponema sp.]|nr:TRAP transporter TatT component family protein [Treponema sp.]